MNQTRAPASERQATRAAPTATTFVAQRQRAEQEADRLADKATRGPDQQPAASSRETAPPVRNGAQADLHALGGLSPHGGRPLPAFERIPLEARLCHDFGRVRVHDDTQAAAAADRLGVPAFTVGSDVVLGAEAQAADSVERARLLAHELVHTAQQDRGAPSLQTDEPVARKGIGSAPPDDAFSVAEGPADEDEHLLFPFDSASLPAGVEKQLATLAARYTTPVTVEIHGYASTEGDAGYNSNLSAHRAAAVRRLLESQLPQGSVVVLWARGETIAFGQPAENRRVGIHVTPGIPAVPVANATTTPVPSSGSWSFDPRRPTGPQPLWGQPPPSLWGQKVIPPVSPGASPPRPRFDLTIPVVGSSIRNRYRTDGTDPVPTPDPLPDPSKLKPLPGEEVSPDWLKLRHPFTSRGLALSPRDRDVIWLNWSNTYAMLRRIGLSPDLSATLATSGTAFAYDSALQKEQPNLLERSLRDEEKFLKPGETNTRIIVPIITPESLEFVFKRKFTF